MAEDNAINKMLAQRLLEKFGYRADVVDNGRKAVTVLETVDYDIVLMDVQMPEMDGYVATSIIRDPNSGVLNHKVPVIAMTANAMPEDRALCLESGMDDYLSKPISPNDLYNMLEKYLQASIKECDDDDCDSSSEKSDGRQGLDTNRNVLKVARINSEGKRNGKNDA